MEDRKMTRRIWVLGIGVFVWMVYWTIEIITSTVLLVSQLIIWMLESLLNERTRKNRLCAVPILCLLWLTALVMLSIANLKDRAYKKLYGLIGNLSSR